MRRLASCAALISALVLAVAGCAKPNAGPGNGNGAFGGNGATTPAAGATGGASPSAGPSPSPSTAASADPLGPVTHPAVANKSGYVWASSPSAATFTATNAYHYNSTGGAVTIARSSTGRYAVTFAGLGDPGGVAHASAYGTNSNFCNVVSWVPSGADEVVSVACYTADTSPVDTTFVANFAVGHQAGAHFSYLWNEQASSTAQHVPATTYRYDSTGHDPWIRKIATGRYRVFLPASYDEQSEPYTFQVTAYGANTFRCHLAAAYVAPGTHEIQCRDALGTLYDTRFSLSFSAEGSIIGRTDLRYGDYTEAAAGVTSPSTGVYSVSADGLDADRGQVVVDARGNTPNYCHVGDWNVSGTALNMTVRCFAPSGAPANTGFTLGVTW
jgi:hypothetical protein